MPELPYEYLPGLRFSSARKALKSFAGKDGCTAIRFGVAARLMIGVKSASGLYGIFGLIAGFAAVVDTVAMPSV